MRVWAGAAGGCALSGRTGSWSCAGEERASEVDQGDEGLASPRRPSVQIQIVLSPTRLAFPSLSLFEQSRTMNSETQTRSVTPLAQATLPSSQATRRARTTTTAACAARRAPCHVGPARLELVKEQDVLFPHALPQDRVEEAAREGERAQGQLRPRAEPRREREREGGDAHVAAALERGRLLHGLGPGLLGEPQPELLVVPPVVLVPARAQAASSQPPPRTRTRTPDERESRRGRTARAPPSPASRRAAASKR